MPLLNFKINKPTCTLTKLAPVKVHKPTSTSQTRAKKNYLIIANLASKNVHCRFQSRKKIQERKILYKISTIVFP